MHEWQFQWTATQHRNRMTKVCSWLFSREVASVIGTLHQFGRGTAVVSLGSLPPFSRVHKYLRKL